jgi:hypothetical protein
MGAIKIIGCNELKDRFMKTWSTTLLAICPIENELCEFNGPNIKAITREEAHQYAQKNKMGYLYIGDPIATEIPCKEGTKDVPDWDKAVHYDQPDIMNN